jgi:hypothetical protein
MDQGLWQQGITSYFRHHRMPDALRLKPIFDNRNSLRQKVKPPSCRAHNEKAARSK